MIQIIQINLKMTHHLFIKIQILIKNHIDRNKDFLKSSSYDKNTKVSSIKENLKNIFNINIVCNSNLLYSVAILLEKYENKNYVISSCPYEEIRVFDYNDNPKRNIDNYTDFTYFIDIFFYKKNDIY